jgi:maleylacetate reductase
MTSPHTANATATALAPFEYEPAPVRVRFGPGSLTSLPALLDTIGIQRALIFSTPGRIGYAEQVAALLGQRCAGISTEARQHVPAETVARARAEASDYGVDGIVAVGGSSTTGLAKALALDPGLPYVAIPTNYAGSEMTPIWGITEHGNKTTGRNPAVLPRGVVYDVDLSLSLPVNASITSGMNAIAHAVEALYAPDSSPLVSLLAEEGVHHLAMALPTIADAPHDITARGHALYGAWLCGTCLGATTMSLHHKVCHVLGGTLGLPHAETHTVILPYVLAFNAPYAATTVEALTRALGSSEPAHVLQELGRRFGAPRSLRDLGMTTDDIETVAASVVDQPYANPRPVSDVDVRSLLTDAYYGVDVRTIDIARSDWQTPR